MKKTRETIIYEETYKKPYPRIFEHKLPVCTHQSDGFKCVRADMMGAGRIKTNEGEELEYQDIRLFLKETVSPNEEKQND